MRREGGSCRVSANKYSCTEKPKLRYFGDLTPYLTYGWESGLFVNFGQSPGSGSRKAKSMRIHPDSYTRFLCSTCFCFPFVAIFVCRLKLILKVVFAGGVQFRSGQLQLVAGEQPGLPARLQHHLPGRGERLPAPPPLHRGGL
jgi:hypothetical protein